MTNYNLHFTGAEIDEAVEKARNHLVTIDTSPTASSTKAVTSDGIKTYVDNSIPYIPQTSLYHYQSSSTLGLSTTTPKTCPLTEVYSDITGASISSSEITLPVGVYNIEGFANIAITNNNQHRGAYHYIEIVGGAILFRGNDVSTYNDYSNNSTRQAVIMNRITVTGSPDTIRWRFTAVGADSSSIGRVWDNTTPIPHAYLKITKVS